MGFPSPSRGVLISKTWRADAMFRRSINSAKYLPGHILGRGERMLACLTRLQDRHREKRQCYLPSTGTKYNSSWIENVWVQLAVANESVRTKLVWILVHGRIVHARPVQNVGMRLEALLSKYKRRLTKCCLSAQSRRARSIHERSRP